MLAGHAGPLMACSIQRQQLLGMKHDANIQSTNQQLPLPRVIGLGDTQAFVSDQSVNGCPTHPPPPGAHRAV
jgi:hypothetical protein